MSTYLQLIPHHPSRPSSLAIPFSSRPSSHLIPRLLRSKLVSSIGQRLCDTSLAFITNMIPEFLQSTYARYKADTNTFATWLLETANECGYQPPDLAAAIPLVEEVKHKGKHIDSDANPLQYRATAKDLQEFAEVVANSAVTILKSVLTIARGAIKSRKSVTSWFRGWGESASNKRHAHFITVLEQICDSLEQKTNQPSKPDTKQPPSTFEAENDDANGDRFLNRFAVLTVEEPPETTHTQPAPTKSKKIVKVDVVEDEPKEAEYLYLG